MTSNLIQEKNELRNEIRNGSKEWNQVMKSKVHYKMDSSLLISFLDFILSSLLYDHNKCKTIKTLRSNYFLVFSFIFFDGVVHKSCG